MKKYFTILLMVFTLMCFLVQKINAQGGPPVPDPQDIPLDGGLGFLLAAGVAYAAKRIYKSRDQEV